MRVSIMAITIHMMSKIIEEKNTKNQQSEFKGN